MTETRRVPGALTPKQLEQRRTVLGGTDWPAILGLSRSRTAWHVYADKHGWQLPERELSEDALWGLLLEPVIRAEYARRTGQPVHKPRRLLRSPHYRWQAGHVDGLVGEQPVAGLEIKVRRSDAAWGEPGSDEIPAEVRAQVEHYLAVTGLPVWDVAVLFRGSRLEIYRVTADESALTDLTAEESEWWERHVVGGEEPPFDGAESTTALIRRTSPPESERTLVALPHQYEPLMAYVAARRMREHWQTEEERQQQLIMRAMGDATVLHAPMLRAYYRTTHPKPRTDWESYAVELEKLVEHLALGILPVTMDPLEVRENLRSLHTITPAGTRTFRVTLDPKELPHDSPDRHRGLAAPRPASVP